MNHLLHGVLTQWRVDPLGVAMPGVRLPGRVRKIFDTKMRGPVSHAHVAGVVAACAVICGTFLAVTLTRGQSVDAGWEKVAGGRMSFEVASVKLNKLGDTSTNFKRSNFPLNNEDGYYANGGLLSATDYPLEEIIGFAYKLTPMQTQSVLSQLPKWATMEAFDIQARAQGDPTKDQMRLMMQSLLADRFRLAAHMESRQGSVYAFVLAKAGELGPHLTRHVDAPPCADLPVPASPGAPPPPTPDLADGLPSACGLIKIKIGPRGYLVTARSVTLGQFATYLPAPPMDPVDRPVVDHTGLSGTFDVALEWEPDTPILLNGSPLPVAKSAEPFTEALKDQLGLKLTPATGEVSTFVIDHIEEPTAN